MSTDTIFYIKNIIYTFVSFLFLFISCNNSHDNNRETNHHGQHNSKNKNGFYCATVTCSNPHSGKLSNYKLTAEVDHDKVIKILWPNGGWLDESHFTPGEIDEHGIVGFITGKGYNYKVQLYGFGVCPTK